MIKNKVLFLFIVSFWQLTAHGQISKGNWMFGGDGSISFSKENNDMISNNIRDFSLNLSPNLGYFFFDKFEGGAEFSFAYQRLKYNSINSESRYFSIGPFLRYYFLNTGNRVNVFAGSAYQYLIISQDSHIPLCQNIFRFSAGPVVYFNPNIGIELTVNYEVGDYTVNISKEKTFSLAIGFQIHLGE